MFGFRVLLKMRLAPSVYAVHPPAPTLRGLECAGLLGEISEDVFRGS